MHAHVASIFTHDLFTPYYAMDGHKGLFEPFARIEDMRPNTWTPDLVRSGNYVFQPTPEPSITITRDTLTVNTKRRAFGATTGECPSLTLPITAGGLVNTIHQTLHGRPAPELEDVTVLQQDAFTKDPGISAEAAADFLQTSYPLNQGLLANAINQLFSTVTHNVAHHH